MTVPCESAAPSHTPPPPTCSAAAPARTSRSATPGGADAAAESGRTLAAVLPPSAPGGSHLFQSSDQLRRGHHVLVTVLLAGVAFAIKQRVRHLTGIFLKTTLTSRNRPARFQYKGGASSRHSGSSRALLAILGMLFFPLFGLSGRSYLESCLSSFVPSMH